MIIVKLRLFPVTNRFSKHRGFYFLFYVFLISFQIAKITEMNRFGLVFGCNMFAALVLQTILTAIVAEKHGLALTAKKQVSNLSM